MRWPDSASIVRISLVVTFAERRRPSPTSGGFQKTKVRLPWGEPSSSTRIASRPVSCWKTSRGLPMVALHAMMRGRDRCHSQSLRRRRRTLPTFEPKTPR